MTVLGVQIIAVCHQLGKGVYRPFRRLVKNTFVFRPRDPVKGFVPTVREQVHPDDRFLVLFHERGDVVDIVLLKVVEDCLYLIQKGLIHVWIAPQGRLRQTLKEDPASQNSQVDHSVTAIPGHQDFTGQTPGQSDFEQTQYRNTYECLCEQERLNPSCNSKSRW